ncbi:MAG: peptidoglycan DD-metalloendopeptidase family protein [Lachnospiraceae bacterium]|nr:peptidoglycan DD-metalloendopeptidase family protein [Lachnospiraceae bacterium]
MRFTIHNKRLEFAYIKTTLLVLFCTMFLVKGYVPFEESGENYFHVYLNGEEVGVVNDRQHAENLFIEARRKVASDNTELMFIDAELEVKGEEVLWGHISDDSLIISRMLEILDMNVMETMQQSYTVKVNETMLNLRSTDEIRALFRQAVAQYDPKGRFAVDLVKDPSRAAAAMTVNIVEQASEKELQAARDAQFRAGIQGFLATAGEEIIATSVQKSLSDYELGISQIAFDKQVEIVEAYLPENQLISMEEAYQELLMCQDVPSEYIVQSGDTLSEISIKVNIPMDELVAMNSSLDSVNSTIRVGDKLTITIPEPELSLLHTQDVYVEEIYDAPVQYVDNTSWYTTQTKVLQQPSAGFRKAVLRISYENDTEKDREVLDQVVLKEAVPKIVERGTKIPPTYIKPISGGRISSYFGKRKAPTKGASTYHKAVDWAIPRGTAVKASCGGTVAKAGWGSGYGYVVYINHDDGRQTRYAHLSKVLVKAGQRVQQGDLIAKSGNTGVSSGPHLHFELLINGRQVDPLKYIR